MLTLSAYAKINWSLDVVARRADGYHELSMLMQRIDLCDTLTLELADAVTLNGDSGADDLVLRAARALQARAFRTPGAAMRLYKRIPTRAGLGGGSADCAAALIGLNALWRLNYSPQTLCDIGRTLGADVPFCLTGGLALVEGIGERVTPCPAARSLPIALCFVEPGLSTPVVFRAFDETARCRPPARQPELMRALCAGDLSGADALARNALYPPAARLLPEIARAIEDLRACGARFARMTGSGSAVFGAFDTEEAAARAVRILPRPARLVHTLLDQKNAYPPFDGRIE